MSSYRTPPPPYTSSGDQNIHPQADNRRSSSETHIFIHRDSNIPGYGTFTDNGKRNSEPSERSNLIMLIIIMMSICAHIVWYVGERSTFPNPAARELWARERRDHEGELAIWAAERQEWAEEEHRHQEENERERVMWAAERLRWAVEERRHQEEDARWEKERVERMRLFWDEPRGDGHCSRYATRAYSARLWNIAPGYDGIKACMQTPVSIHDKIIAHPDQCEDLGLRDGIRGRWLVNFEEPVCQPYWGQMYDKGCVGDGSGFHRFEARLWNLNNGDDWDIMCSTTPNVINGIPFDKPSHCEYWGALYGMVGIWEYKDSHC